jgi:hypothetical protein
MSVYANHGVLRGGLDPSGLFVIKPSAKNAIGAIDKGSGTNQYGTVIASVQAYAHLGYKKNIPGFEGKIGKWWLGGQTDFLFIAAKTELFKACCKTYRWEQRGKEIGEDWSPDGDGGPGLIQGYAKAETWADTAFSNGAQTVDYPGWGSDPGWAEWAPPWDLHMYRRLDVTSIVVCSQGIWINRILARVDWSVSKSGPHPGWTYKPYEATIQAEGPGP